MTLKSEIKTTNFPNLQNFEIDLELAIKQKNCPVKKWGRGFYTPTSKSDKRVLFF